MPVKITKASVASFLLAPIFVAQAVNILSLCPKPKFAVSEAENLCESHGFDLIASGLFTIGFACFFASFVIIWRTRKVKELSLLDYRIGFVERIRLQTWSVLLERAFLLPLIPAVFLFWAILWLLRDAADCRIRRAGNIEAAEGCDVIVYELVWWIASLSVGCVLGSLVLLIKNMTAEKSLSLRGNKF